MYTHKLTHWTNTHTLTHTHYIHYTHTYILWGFIVNIFFWPWFIIHYYLFNVLVCHNIYYKLINDELVKKRKVEKCG